MYYKIFQGILIPFIGTSAGAAMVFLLKKRISEMSEGKHSNWGTVAFSFGFVVMMILDVALG